MGSSGRVANAVATSVLEQVNAVTTNSNLTISVDDGLIHDITLTGNITITLPDVSAYEGETAGITLRLRQDDVGGRTVAFADSVRWPGGTQPTLSTDADAIDVIVLIGDSEDDIWDGFASGIGMAIA